MERASRLSSGLNPAPLINQPPTDPRRSNSEPVVSLELHVQTYGGPRTSADLFAQLPVDGGKFSPNAAVVDREAIASALGATSEGEVVYTRPEGVSVKEPHVLMGALSLRKLFRWQFGARGKPSSFLRSYGACLRHPV